ncbi:ileal sodium/bile acid cotransporter-like protein 3 [Leptotrombidium deliense]|uniref:Ileal sodium/bile acid cotransporter-like protein 3 n=1 Tax=Leptotrombidium deliense TaxID=299467 RepID=A0A443S4T2_9ACAR|nr:ileal sodium/bile acid cotransporter-like protein 3 [Leptotrombidium deliense]
MSTVAALVMMPFNVWIYGTSLENESIVIPYKKMALSLAFLTAPVAFGMIVLWKFPKVAPILTKIGSFAGFAIIIVCETLEVLIFPDIFDDVPFKLYAAEILLPLLGLTLGYGLATIFRLKKCERRTVAIECGIQNVGTALAIVSLSYPFHQLRKVWLFPFLYAFSMLGICIVISGLYQLHKRYIGHKFDVSQVTKHELNERESNLQNSKYYSFAISQIFQ